LPRGGARKIYHPPAGPLDGTVRVCDSVPARVIDFNLDIDSVLGEVQLPVPAICRR
jgi:hypothetical protein